MNRLPAWFRQEIPDAKTFARARLLSVSGVRTVCQEARCPNLNRCFRQAKFTFLILGDTCTRACRFCAVTKAGNAKRLGWDADEPQRIAGIVKRLGLSFVVITSVTRDDLKDGGAGIFARTIRLIRGINKEIKIEALIPDFQGNSASIKMVADAGPEVIAHNIETVSRLYAHLRPQADYRLSLTVLKKIRQLNPMVATKSSLMLGLGETEKEVIRTMQDLRKNDCDILTLGQYLAPSAAHYPLKEFISPGQFRRLRRIGLAMGFKSVSSGPLVRSSYQAQDLYQELAYA